MNILFAAEYYFANPPLVHISIELAKRKHNVSVATSRRIVDEKTMEGVKIFEIEPLVTIYSIPRALSFPFMKMSKIFKDQHIEVVHSPNDYSNNVAISALVARSTNRPFVYAIQGTGTRTGHPPVDTLVRAYDWTAGRWLIRQARRIILLTKGLIPTARKFGIAPSKIAIVPSGVDIVRFDPESPLVKEKASLLREKLNVSEQVIIGYAGRLYPAKGLTYLFSAVRAISETHHKIALLIVGDGAQRRELETIARDLNIKAVFVGWQHDTAPYYAMMDIFVLPSLFEGLPNVVLEAMAMKKPVVATNVGGNPDVISNGVNGFLVPVRDVATLTAALERLIGDDNLRNRMGVMNRQKIENHFLWSQTVDKIEEIYREVS